MGIEEYAVNALRELHLRTYRGSPVGTRHANRIIYHLLTKKDPPRLDTRWQGNSGYLIGCCRRAMRDIDQLEEDLRLAGWLFWPA